jgi:hypothetical protein
LAHTSALLTREVYADKNLKENINGIAVFVSAVAPCAQLSYRYISAHLHTFRMHGIGSKTEESACSASCPTNDAYQRHFMFSLTTINLSPSRTPRMDPPVTPGRGSFRPPLGREKKNEESERRCPRRTQTHNMWLNLRRTAMSLRDQVVSAFSVRTACFTTPCFLNMRFLGACWCVLCKH